MAENAWHCVLLFIVDSSDFKIEVCNSDGYQRIDKIKKTER